MSNDKSNLKYADKAWAEDDSELAIQDSELLLNENLLKRRSRSWCCPSWLWIMATCVFAALWVKASLQQWTGQVSPLGSYEAGFKTDFGPVKSEIGLIEYRFTGGLHLDSNGRLVREVDPEQPQYAGTPSEEIDDSWEDLLSALEIVVSGDEASEVAQKTIRDREEDSWRMSLDVYHSIHCLNLVCKGLDPDHYYPSGKQPYHYRMHLEHCVDYLRQVIQCQTDLTPLMYYHEPRYNTSMPIFGQPHMCRDFSKVHKWAMEREGHLLPGS